MRSTCVLVLFLSLALCGCRNDETATRPVVKFVPDKIKNPPPKEPAPGDKDPPKYKVQ